MLTRRGAQKTLTRRVKARGIYPELRARGMKNVRGIFHGFLVFPFFGFLGVGILSLSADFWAL